MFAAPLWVSVLTLLVYGGAESAQSELLRVGNFQGLTAGTADDPFDGIFPVWKVVCGSKGYSNRPC